MTNFESASSSQADSEPRSVSPPAERGPFTAVFRDVGDSAALNAAIAWLKARGFSVGAEQKGAPIGVVLGEVSIAKWSHLDAEEIADLHGRITTPTLSYRSGPVTVTINKYAHSSVLEAFRS